MGFPDQQKSWSVPLRDIPLIWSQLGVPVKCEPDGYDFNQQNMTNWSIENYKISDWKAGI